MRLVNLPRKCLLSSESSKCCISCSIVPDKIKRAQGWTRWLMFTAFHGMPWQFQILRSACLSLSWSSIVLWVLSLELFRLLCNHWEQWLSRLYGLYDHQPTIWQPVCALSWRCFRSCSFWLCKASTSCAWSKIHKSFHYFSLVFRHFKAKVRGKYLIPKAKQQVIYILKCVKCLACLKLLRIAPQSFSTYLFPHLIKFQCWATQKRTQYVKLRSLLFE